MTEYISKDQLHKITKPFKDSFLSFLADEIDKLVDAMKPADVQPVKHGRWEEVHHWFEDIEYSCSVCGCYALYKELTNDQICSEYCPHCGAKMDDEDNG